MAGMENLLKIAADFRKRANTALDGPDIEISTDGAIVMLATVFIAALVGGLLGGLLTVGLFALFSH
jgi:hypothetical protein